MKTALHKTNIFRVNSDEEFVSTKKGCCGKKKVKVPITSFFEATDWGSATKGQDEYLCKRLSLKTLRFTVTHDHRMASVLNYTVKYMLFIKIAKSDSSRFLIKY